MACADVDMDIRGADEEPPRADWRAPQRIQHYQASEMMPNDKRPLHDLLEKQPAVLGSLQMVSGLLSVGVGIIFAVTQEMTESLCTLFRVSHMTGMLSAVCCIPPLQFIIAGVISNLLFKYPGLLPVSLVVNSGCIIVAVVAACLISVDLAHWNPENDQLLRMEMLELGVLGLEVILSAILCFWFSKERHSKSSSC